MWTSTGTGLITGTVSVHLRTPLISGWVRVYPLYLLPPPSSHAKSEGSRQHVFVIGACHYALDDCMNCNLNFLSNLTTLLIEQAD